MISFFPLDEQQWLYVRLLILLLFLAKVVLTENLSALFIPGMLLSFFYCSVLWSVNAPLSFHKITDLLYYVLLFTLFRSGVFSNQQVLWGVRLLVMISCLLSIDGLYQLIAGYQANFQYLDQHPEAFSETTRQLMRDWLNATSGRIFSRFALPSQLAGYFLMILPLNLLLLIREKRVSLKICWGGIFLVNSVVFLYTKSFGAWLVMLCLCMMGIYGYLSQKRAISLRMLCKIGSGLLISGGILFYIIGMIRGQFLWDFQGNNPLWYRFLNWKIALHIFQDHPFLGTGFFTFGHLYPQYMIPGANQSQYVHNSYLQFGVEFGMIGLIFAIWFGCSWCFSLLKKLSEQFRSGQFDALAVSFFLGGTGFLLHNIIDFDVYVFPLGALGMVMLALTANLLIPQVESTAQPSQYATLKKIVTFLLVSSVLIGIYVADWRYIHGKAYKDEATAAVESRDYAAAATSLQGALAETPHFPEYLAFQGNIFLSQHQPDSAISQFQAAIQQTPDVPWFHAGLADAFLAKGNLAMAYVESRRAAELFPQKEVYAQHAQQIRTLLENK